MFCSSRSRTADVLFAREVSFAESVAVVEVLIGRLDWGNGMEGAATAAGTAATGAITGRFDRVSELGGVPATAGSAVTGVLTARLDWVSELEGVAVTAGPVATGVSTGSSGLDDELEGVATTAGPVATRVSTGRSDRGNELEGAATAANTAAAGVLMGLLNWNNELDGAATAAGALSMPSVNVNANGTGPACGNLVSSCVPLVWTGPLFSRCAIRDAMTASGLMKLNSCPGSRNLYPVRGGPKKWREASLLDGNPNFLLVLWSQFDQLLFESRRTHPNIIGKANGKVLLMNPGIE
ncbi:hypothetical protein K491DRAFT_213624 [Lophiostoma macrostomum CBS 122681]|uniref:Uncharacterized protein n=1 Tax=Lophiostoma macrostomum CBS 122681 TaxID=1314788 RepID=A0A6A6SNH2_9PLEO|nr:hypothetical protein K491DRAFT_213624 [Lophiostoma macrostomum CBS 122681]